MNVNEQNVRSASQSQGVNRRDFMKIAGRFGVMSTLLAAASSTGILATADLARAAESTQQKRYGKKARVTLKFSGSDYNAERVLLLRTGFLDFVRDIEGRTDGEIRIEWFGDSTITTQADCVTKSQQGIVDIYGANTQNMAMQGPYFNAVDFAYMFPNAAAIYHFLYHPKSEKLWREPLRRLHNSRFLFCQSELRGLCLGEKYRNTPLVTSLDQLKGAKIRTAGSQLCIIALRLMGINPVPVAWAETPDAMRQGLVDGLELSPQATILGLTPVISQYLDIRFYPSTCGACMNNKKFESLPVELQDAIEESAYFTQAFIQCAGEATTVNSVGSVEKPAPQTYFARDKVRTSMFSNEKREELARLCSPKYNPKPWESWRERINKWAGGVDVYEEISAIAREIPVDMPTENLPTRRWWRG